MNITKFNEKFNRVEGNIYTVEEVVTPIDGVYEAPLIHDNASNINVYTGSKLTGDKINTYSLSTPSLTPWKTVIMIYSNEPKLYITYETTGDTVEADDINNLQDSVNETQEALNNEITRATNRENTIESNLNKEIDRAKQKENEIANNLSEEIARAEESENIITGNLETEVSRARNAESIITSNLDKEINRSMGKESEIEENLTNEVTRAKNSESTLATNLNKEVERAKDEEKTLTDNLNKEINRAKEKESKIESDINANRANWNDAYNKRHTHANKSIIDGITQALVTNWNSAFSHISDNIKHITAGERSNWNDANNKKHEHSNKSILDTITSALISNWNSAFTHISDAVKHITNAERTLWNTVSSKLDKSGGTMTGRLKLNDTSMDIIKPTVTTVNSSWARGVYLRDTDETTPIGSFGYYGDNSVNGFEYLYAGVGETPWEMNSGLTISSSDIKFKNNKVYHTGNKPTKSDIGLGNVDNTSDLNKPISTATQTALNGKANSSHTHDDRYYTESEIDSKVSALNTSISGKANTSHTHTKSQITDMPTKLSQFTNDAGFVKQADIDISQNHTHSNKSILDKITQGSLDSWNDGARRVAFVGSDAENSNGWYKVASQTCSDYGDTNITFMVTSTYANYNFGILQLQIRSDNTNISCRRFSWLVRTGLDINHYIVVINGMTWALYAQQPSTRYGRLAFEILSMSNINSKGMTWALSFADNNTKEATTPTATVKSSDGATVQYANSSGSATKATQDSDGKQINTTYVKKGMTWNQLEGV